MSWADCKRIMKGIIILFICIMLGVMAAEKQLNELTEYHDFVQACNIQGDSNHSYSLYFLGYRYTLPYNADFTNSFSSLKYVPEKSRELVRLVSSWTLTAREAGVKRAYQFKQQFKEVCQEILYEVENY